MKQKQNLKLKRVKCKYPECGEFLSEEQLHEGREYHSRSCHAKDLGRLGLLTGRPPKPIGEKQVNFTISLSPDLAAKAAKLGGSKLPRDIPAIKNGIRELLAAN